MKKIITKSILAAVCSTALISLSFSAHAGDCKKVKFQITNGLSQSIKVQKIDASGNDGSWTENIRNKKLNPGTSYKTGARRLNKLDSGENGDFTVKFKQLNPNTGRWDARSKVFSGTCRDKMTYSFNIN